MSTDSGLLRTLLTDAKFVHPSVIDRFIDQYELNKLNFDKNPLSLLDYMKHTNAHGEQIWKYFRNLEEDMCMGPMVSKNHLAWGNGGMMSWGQFNPVMMGMMNNIGDPNMMFNSMMMSMII